MVPTDLRPSALGLLLAAAVVLSGCSAATGPLGDDQEAAVADRVEQRMNDIDGFSATRTNTVTVDGETQTSRAEVWIRPDTGQSRSEALSPERQAGDVTVVGDDVTWYYDASENLATRTNITIPDSTDSGIGGQLSRLVEDRSVVYDGEVQLEGQSVWKVRLLPDNESDDRITSNVTMWVDTEKRFPVQVRYAMSGELNVTATVHYDDLTINPGIDDARFTYEPPANATVERDSVDLRTFDSRAELAASANATVPDPEVPDGFDFESGSTIDGAVSMQYSNGSASVSVTHSPDAAGPPSDRGESVSVGDHDGRYVSIGETGSVQWTCDDGRLSVAGDVDRETLLTVAESIGCP
jgi:outer membrane lipoprotein-sorting protein